MTSLLEKAYNPDVLTCLANLSNDEVFTPPELANDVLDMLPPEIWSDPTIKILDPCCKSGVFLREAAKRFIKGLEHAYPDLQERVEHIMHEQLFGIAITELTSLLSRRSLYCSKFPNGRFSVAEFDSSEGNVRHRTIQHTWVNNRCKYCGASNAEYDRDATLETHAYEFIHTGDPERILNMKFDVIVGNPPYQLSDGGGEGSSAVPLYHKFIEQAIKLSPRYLSMIVPARWYSGGKGLDGFRKQMLGDDRISCIHDFPETSICFPGVNIRGGVCYFLWDRQHHGPAHVFNHSTSAETNVMQRPLLESGNDCFVRYNEAISILNKVKKRGEKTYGSRVHSRNPFGIPSNYSSYQTMRKSDDDLVLYRSRRGSNADKRVFITREEVKKGQNLIPSIKVLVSKASPGGDEYPHSIFSQPLIGEAGSVCTETYLVVDVVNTIDEANCLIAYMQTRFFRFLVSLLKTTQNISKSCFEYVPVLDLNIAWTDKMLSERYGLTSREESFIESMIKPMGNEDE